MRKKRMLTGIAVGVSISLLFSAFLVLAGSLEPIAGPAETGSQMYTLQQIYDRLTSGTSGIRMPSFLEPASGQASSGRTLDEIRGKLPALDDASGAEPAHVATGKTYWGLTSGQWGLKTGAMATQVFSPDSATVSAGYYQATTLTTVDPDLATGNIRAGVTLFGVSGKTSVVDTSSGDATAGNILSGRKAWVDGVEVTGTMITQTLSPDSATVSGGYYQATTLTTVDPDLATGNIKKDVNIFGMVGTYNVWPSSTAPVPRTGQTPTVPLASSPLGSDGALQKGVAWPNPRFTDNANGTVTDNLTGLIWLRDADCFEVASWEMALSEANSLASGSCALTDGSVAGDWRLPNVKEFKSLIDYAYYDPALSNTTGTGQWTPGNPFINVRTYGYSYWSSSTYATADYFTYFAWLVSMWDGRAYYNQKNFTNNVWPVRSGQ